MLNPNVSFSLDVLDEISRTHLSTLQGPEGNNEDLQDKVKRISKNVGQIHRHILSERPFPGLIQEELTGLAIVQYIPQLISLRYGVTALLGQKSFTEENYQLSCQVSDEVIKNLREVLALVQEPVLRNTHIGYDRNLGKLQRAIGSITPPTQELGQIIVCGQDNLAEISLNLMVDAPSQQVH